MVDQARQSPRPSLALQQVPGTEARSRAGAPPRPAPTYLLRRGGDGWSPHLGAAPCPAGPGSAEPRQSRERAELTTATPQPASLLPRPHFCAHPTLPAVYPPGRLGGTQVEKGECQPLKMGPPPPPPTDIEGARTFQQGQLKSGDSLGFPRAPGTSSHIPLQGTGPHDPEQPSGNPNRASGPRRGWPESWGP